jgi:ribosomal protein L12E/L44/L45/RPP1/RPP2
VSHRQSNELRQAAGDAHYPVDLILPDAVIDSIVLAHPSAVRLRSGLLSAVKSAPGSEFDIRFAPGITSVINRFELDAKLHKGEWQPAYKQATAAAKAARAAAKARKARGQANGDSDEEEDSEDDDEESESESVEPILEGPRQARRLLK